MVVSPCWGFWGIASTTPRPASPSVRERFVDEADHHPDQHPEENAPGGAQDEDLPVPDRPAPEVHHLLPRGRWHSGRLLRWLRVKHGQFSLLGFGAVWFSGFRSVGMWTKMKEAPRLRAAFT